MEARWQWSTNFDVKCHQEAPPCYTSKIHDVLACFVDLTQTRVTSGEGASFEELWLSEWPVDNAEGSFSWSLTDVGVLGPLRMGPPWAGGPGLHKETGRASDGLLSGCYKMKEIHSFPSCFGSQCLAQQQVN